MTQKNLNSGIDPETNGVGAGSRPRTNEATPQTKPVGRVSTRQPKRGNDPETKDVGAAPAANKPGNPDKQPQITHHGGGTGVTGSCHRLQITEDQAILVDCGLFQGKDHGPEDTLDRHKIDFPIDDVVALVVTHVHIDHVGRIPYLLAAGYQGPIYCSHPSAKLLPLVLEDALKIGFTRNNHLIERFLEEIEQRTQPIDYNNWHNIIDDDQNKVRLRLQRAGHILGSAYAEFDITNKHNQKNHRIVFTGDLGAPNAPLLPAPQSPERADVLVLESTYGNRTHEDREHRTNRLKSTIEHALTNKGTVIIPAFAIGRTQELLYELETIIHEESSANPQSQTRSPHREEGQGEGETAIATPNERPPLPRLGGEGQGEGETKTTDQTEAPTPKTKQVGATSRSRTNKPMPQTNDVGATSVANWQNLEIIVDSPLASNFTKAYRDLKKYWDKEAQQRIETNRHPLNFENLYTIDTHKQHQQTVDYLTKTTRPAVVITASGMCTAGRVLNYLEKMLEDEHHTVLFIGYQAEGTPGHAIQQAGQGGTIELNGKQIQIRARIETISGYSAHADQQNLLDFVTNMNEWPQEIRLVHGDPEAQRQLRAALEGRAMSEKQEVTVITADDGSQKRADNGRHILRGASADLRRAGSGIAS